MLRFMKPPASLGAKLTAATRRRVSKSAIVRRALETELTRKRGARPRSFGDIAGDLAGCLSGPDDLSFNPRHMRGYGR